MPGMSKGYAIYTMKALKMGDLKSTLAPLLKEPGLGYMAYSALLNSPSSEDQAFANLLGEGIGEMPNYVLDTYAHSSKPELWRKFLLGLRDRPVAADYNFTPSMDLLMKSKTVLPELKDTIRRTQNRQVVPGLIRLLPVEKDADTAELLAQLAKDKDPAIRAAAIKLSR